MGRRTTARARASPRAFAFAPSAAPSARDQSLASSRTSTGTVVDARSSRDAATSTSPTGCPSCRCATSWSFRTSSCRCSSDARRRWPRWRRRRRRSSRAARRAARRRGPGTRGRRPLPRRRRRAHHAGRRDCRTGRCACWSRASLARASRATCTATGHLRATSRRRRCPHRRSPTEDSRRARAARVWRCSRSTSRCTGGSRPRWSTLVQGADAERTAGVRHRRAPRACDTTCGRRCSSRRRSPTCSRSLGELLAREIELLRLERKIDDDVRGSLFQNQREFYLQEQLKAIHRELGQEDGDDLDDLDAADRREGAARGGAGRARSASCASCAACRRCRPRRRSSRNFLDWMLALPWTRADRRRARRRARAPRARRGPLRSRRSEGPHPRLHRACCRSSASSRGRSSASSGRRASARRRSADRSRARWAASSSACRSAACATKRRSAATGARTSARCRAASSRRCGAPRS